jgi:hypothetical protein
MRLRLLLDSLTRLKKDDRLRAVSPRRVNEPWVSTASAATEESG